MPSMEASAQKLQAIEPVLPKGCQPVIVDGEKKVPDKAGLNLYAGTLCLTPTKAASVPNNLTGQAKPSGTLDSPAER